MSVHTLVQMDFAMLVKLLQSSCNSFCNVAGVTYEVAVVEGDTVELLVLVTAVA